MGPKTIGETIYVNEGEYAKVDYYCMPDEGINYGESTDLCAIDDDVVEVGSAGVIYGAKAGETYLICTCEGTTTFCKVVVTDGKVHRGDKFTRNGIKYQVTGTGKYRTVKAIGLTSKKKKAKSLTIPATIKVNGQYYKVTSIATGAFKGMKNLKTAIIGKNVGIIGKSAFRNCKKLKTVKIYAPQAKIYSTTFKNIAKKAVYKVKKSALKYYKLVQKNKVVKASL